MHVLHDFFRKSSSPCWRRCSTIFRNTKGTPSFTRPLSCSSDRDAPNSLVCLTVQGRSMGIWTIFFMSSLTSTAVLLCYRENIYQESATDTMVTEGSAGASIRLDTCPGGSACSIDFKVCGGGISVEFIRAHFLQSYSHTLRGQCVLRAERAGCALCCYDKYQVTMQHLWLKVLLERHTPAQITYRLRWGDHNIGI